MATANDDYDTPWKTALTRYFPEFMAFYFPQAHAAIDWTQPHVFLDQELAKLAGDGKRGSRVVDKLVRVKLRHGGQQWVLVHVEVQGRRERGFAERMFVYHYRIYDMYRQKVASLAVMASGGAHDTAAFGYTLFGCQLRFEFPLAVLDNYQDVLADLLADPNPFALVTAAHLLTRQTRGRVHRRRAEKWRLTKALYQRRWDRQSIIDLYLVIDWMMRLPPELEQRLWQGVEALERRGVMRYVSSIERIGREKGKKEGLQEGMQQGLAAAVLKVLRSRFGDVDEGVRRRVARAQEAELNLWLDRMLTAPTLDDVFLGK